MKLARRYLPTIKWRNYPERQGSLKTICIPNQLNLANNLWQVITEQ